MTGQPADDLGTIHPLVSYVSNAMHAHGAGLRQNEVPYLLHSGGKDVWTHLSEHPEEEALFSAAMGEHDKVGVDISVRLGQAGHVRGYTMHGKLCTHTSRGVTNLRLRDFLNS